MTGGWVRDPEPLPDAEWVWLDDPHHPGWIIPREVTAEIYRRWVANGRRFGVG